MIRSDVPPKLKLNGVNTLTIVGMVATAARKIPPAKHSLLIILDRYSTVATPGQIPGMNPPFCLMLSATSAGLNIIAV